MSRQISAESGSGEYLLQAGVFALGDVELDGDIDAADIDALYASFGNPAGSPSADVDRHGDADDQDVQYLVEQVIGTGFGDADLNTVIDIVDFGALASGFGSSGGWAEGNFDGKGGADILDFGVFAASFGRDFTEALIGDVDQDGDIDADDIDTLYASFGSPALTPSADLDSDIDADEEDVRVLVEDIIGTAFGDASLDHVVDIVDFGALAGGFGGTGGWMHGNFDGTPSVNIVDFGLFEGNFGAPFTVSAPVPAGPDGPSDSNPLCTESRFNARSGQSRRRAGDRTVFPADLEADKVTQKHSTGSNGGRARIQSACGKRHSAGRMASVWLSGGP